MKFRNVKRFVSVFMALALAVIGLPEMNFETKAAVDLETAVEKDFTIKASEINQLLTDDLRLPTTVPGISDAVVTYSVGDADSEYVSVDGNVLRVTRPYVGEEDYSFTLTATVRSGEDTVTKDFPLTIRAGLSDDSYAGYLYTSFAAVGGADVQQVHFFLSEDGLNWTAVNGCNPAFLAGSDYTGMIDKVSTRNYEIKSGTGSDKLKATVSGDASVLFPFEGDDQGIRDPYMLRGSKKDGSDANKVWLLATDLNTMDSKYGGNKTNDTVGNWGMMSSQGSTSLFIYETEDFIHWERRYVDVGTEVGAGAAWAPEAIYNPQKDNYLVYWSCRSTVDGLARNRIYCNETDDFVTFGPTKMYEQEPFYLDWADMSAFEAEGRDFSSNIDTSQLWVADENGNPYGTVYRVVKDETNNHIQLMSASSVLDPDVDYDNSNPMRITPYEKDGKTYSSLSDISGLGKKDKAEIIYKWFEKETVGGHFVKVPQANVEIMSGAYEGATMFKFIDRDEWCIMIDYYGDMNVRYEPYVTYDLSEPDSVVKVTSGYGRTGGDVGTHGGMMPITVKEYNAIIDTYNSDPTVNNYHQIDYIPVDKRCLSDILADINEALKDTAGMSADNVRYLERQRITLITAIYNDRLSSEEVEEIRKTAEAGYKEITLKTDKDSVDLKKGESVKVNVEEEGTFTWESKDTSVATVNDGLITAVGAGSTFVVARSEDGRFARITVKVTEEQKATEPPKATESPETTEPPKTTESPKTTEPPKVTESPKATEPPKMTEPPKPTESPEKTEEPKATEAPQNTDSPGAEGSPQTPGDNTSSGNDKQGSAVQTPGSVDAEQLPLPGISQNTVKAGLKIKARKTVKVNKTIKLKVKKIKLKGKVKWKIVKGKSLAKLNKKKGKKVKLVTGSKKGTVKIRVKCKGKKKTIRIKIK